MADQGQRSGLIGAFKRLAETAASTLQSRLELFSLELREEKIRATTAIALAIVCAFSGGLFLISTMILAALVFEEHQILVVGIFCGIYLIIAVWSGLTIKKIIGEGANAFSETINQLKQDAECLRK